MTIEEEHIQEQPEHTGEEPSHEEHTIEEQQQGEEIVEEQQEPAQEQTPQQNGLGKKVLIIFLNIIIAVLLILTGYFGHKFIDRYYHNIIPPNVRQEQEAAPQQTAQQTEQKADTQKLAKIVQVDIQNGSGEKGIASRFTNFLRSRGYDVVEAKNYKVSNVPHTLIIERLGNLQIARDLAEHIGVADTNIIQQLNPDYFVDVSIVIGQDCYELYPSKETK